MREVPEKPMEGEKGLPELLGCFEGGFGPESGGGAERCGLPQRRGTNEIRFLGKSTQKRKDSHAVDQGN